MEAEKETKFGTNVAWRTRMMSNVDCTHSAEKARDTTLDNENASQHDVRFSDGAL